MASDNNALQIWEHFFARQTPDDLVHKIERSKFVIANLAAAGAPTVGSLRFADPVGLIRSQGVATITDLISGRIATRRKARRNDDGVVQSTSQERRSKHSAEVIVCIAINTVHEDEGLVYEPTVINSINGPGFGAMERGSYCFERDRGDCLK